MKKAIQTAIKSIVTLFILFRMSKCQKNKYFIGSSCGAGSSGPKTENKEFQQSFANLMAARDAQDRTMAEPIVKAMPATNENSQKPQTAIIAAKAPPSQDKKSCIDIILGGDF